MGVVFGVAALLGLYLAWLGGLPIVLIGIAAIISAIAYTGGPFPLGYHGLGDIFVFIFFGLAAVAGTYYVQAGSVSAAAWWMTIPPGLIITAILVVNNLRDIDNDRKGGKHTLAVRIGERATKIQYLICMVVAYLILPLAAWMGIVSWFSLLAWGSLPIAFRAARTVFTQKGRPLNAALAGTGQAAFVFSRAVLGGDGVGVSAVHGLPSTRLRSKKQTSTCTTVSPPNPRRSTCRVPAGSWRSRPRTWRDN